MMIYDNNVIMKQIIPKVQIHKSKKYDDIQHIYVQTSSLMTKLKSRTNTRTQFNCQYLTNLMTCLDKSLDEIKLIEYDPLIIHAQFLYRTQLRIFVERIENFK